MHKTPHSQDVWGQADHKLPAWLQRQHWPRETRDTLFTLLVVGWIILPLLTHVPLWCAALAVSVLLSRAWLAIRQRPLPGRKIIWPLLLLSVVATLYSHHRILGTDSGITLLVALVSLKTLELRAQRDAQVIFFLGFFILLTHLIYSQSLLTATSILIGLLGLLTGLINANQPVGTPRLLASMRTGLWMTAAGAPLVVTLFIFFPRFEPLWSLPSDAPSARSGLSADMEIGGLSNLALDESIALRVKFNQTLPPAHDLYFRGPVLAHFDGRHWKPLPAKGRPRSRLLSARQDLHTKGPAYAYEVMLEPHHHNWLMVLDMARQPPELPPGWHARMNADMQWLSHKPIHQKLRYAAHSQTRYQYGLDAGQKQLLPDFLQLPEGYNPRTQNLARQMREIWGSDDNALIAAALEKLQKEDYVYTLQAGAVGRDSADDFWFESKKGFCEHIASAFVILMRAAGIPARIVTGYQGGELNPLDHYWVVRNSDAHAWVEVWLPRRGWTRVDPTAAIAPERIEQSSRLQAPASRFSRIIATTGINWLLHLRNFREALDNHWSQWVLNHTQTRQMQLLKRLGFAHPDWTDLLVVLAALLSLMALSSIVWLHFQRQQHDPWLKLLHQSCKKLQAAGVQLPAQASPREIMRALDGSSLPAQTRKALKQWLMLMEQFRYGKPQSTSLIKIVTLQKLYKQISWPSRP